MVNEVMGMVEMVQGMKRLRREEGLGQSPWGPNLVNGPEGGGKRLWRCNIPEKRTFGHGSVARSAGWGGQWQTRGQLRDLAF